MRMGMGIGMNEWKGKGLETWLHTIVMGKMRARIITIKPTHPTNRLGYIKRLFENKNSMQCKRKKGTKLYKNESEYYNEIILLFAT